MKIPTGYIFIPIIFSFRSPYRSNDNNACYVNPGGGVYNYYNTVYWDSGGALRTLLVIALYTVYTEFAMMELCITQMYIKIPTDYI